MKIILEDRIRVIDLPKEKTWSEDEFYEFCMVNKELNLERDKDGNVLIMSPVFSQSGMFEARILGRLDRWNEEAGLGYVFSSQAGFTLPNSAVRAPDASWIEQSRWNLLSEEAKDKFAHICPDFVVELRSKSDSIEPLQEKMQEYLENGARLGFLIDPYKRQAWIHRPGVEAELIEDFESCLSGEPVLPGFELPLTIFRL
jgi:Uma2 family endonuclease